MESEKSKILIIGVTGRLGFELAKASLNSLHPTFGLVRDSAFSDPHKSQKLHFLSGAGVTLIKGSLQDEDILVEALKQVDVVICAVSSKQVLEQKLLVSAIKRAGCIKRFLPSEFGSDPDRTRISDLDHNFYSRKSEIRRLIEAEGIPYTYVCCNFFTSFFLLSLVQPGRKNPPRDEVSIFGDGTAKGQMIDPSQFCLKQEYNISYNVSNIYMRPPGNVYSMNELVDIWEGKIGKTLKRNYITEDELLKKIREMPYPENMELVFIYSAFVKGDQTYFSIDSSGGLEGTQLYPQITYTTISEFLDTLL
ncbi:putative pinoresinol-lariciresinol reductase 3 [Nicotiana tabacum]|uniref:Pinoresinol-lariciresinol reductase 3 n=1 Tax=Nicotiana tabacum TaxID=4097 RepID=A0AC58UMW1_TOBAC